MSFNALKVLGSLAINSARQIDKLRTTINKLERNCSKLQSKCDHLHKELELERKRNSDLSAKIPQDSPGSEYQDSLNKEAHMVLVRLAQAYPGNFRDSLSGQYPGQKIQQIKIVRNLFGLGLREAKDFVEKIHSSLCR